MKLFLLLAFFLSASLCPNDEVKKLLCDKKWRIAYIKTADTIIKAPDHIPVEERPWVHFARDGKFEANLEGESTKGSWNFGKEMYEITTVEDGDPPQRSELKILLLTRDSLELRTPNQYVLGMYCPDTTSSK